jgi:hypothetical protein
MHDRVIGSFVFAEDTVTGANYYDMIHEYLLPQVLELQPKKMEHLIGLYKLGTF